MKWENPTVELRERSVATNSNPWLLVGAAIIGVGGWLYCDIRYGKSFGASIGIKGWSVSVNVGCH